MHADAPGCQAGQQAYCQLPDSAAVVCPAGLTMGVSPDELLLLGRQDYVVRSVRLDTKAETWNATFSKLFMIPAGAPGSIREFLQDGRTAAPATPTAGVCCWAGQTLKSVHVGVHVGVYL